MKKLASRTLNTQQGISQRRLRTSNLKEMNDKPVQVKDIPTIRILMLGDRGVGKTSVVNLMAKSEDTPTLASRSVSDRYWDIQVRLHEYFNYVNLPSMSTLTSPSLSPSETSVKSLCLLPPPPTADLLYFVEFIDISTDCRQHRLHFRHLFKSIDGIVLVYNLQNVNSQDSLHDWLYDPLRQICKHRHGRRRPILKTHHVPIMVVGTRLDKLLTLPLPRSGIAHQLNAEEILLNCLDPESFADKSRNQNKLNGFLNRVVEFKEQYPLWQSVYQS